MESSKKVDVIYVLLIYRDKKKTKIVEAIFGKDEKTGR